MRHFLTILFLSVCVLHAETNSTPLLRAHAHNDYNHKRPLLDALEHHFCSVEADIHLTNGQLLVAHDLEDVVPERSLEKLYLRPLREQVLKNGGRVYPNGPSVVLLIDLKSKAAQIYPVLEKLLKNYSEMLTKFSPEKIETNAVTIILTGNRSVELLAGKSNRLAACDGLIADLDSDLPAKLVPWISGEWRKYFHWNGYGEMPVAEKNQLRDFVFKAHRDGRQLRFWGAPDQTAVWQELRKADVDWIGADNLDALEKFFRSAK